MPPAPDPAVPVVAAAARGALRPGELRTLLGEVLPGPRPVVGLLSDEAVALLPVDLAGGDVAARIRTALEALVPGLTSSGLAVGVSDVAAAGGLRGAVEEARYARRLAAGRSDPICVVGHDELATHVLLFGVGVFGAMVVTVAIGASRTFGWCAAGSDFTRYLPLSISPARVGLASGGGAAITGLWMYLVGAAIGTFLAPAGPAEMVTGTVPAGLAKIALAALLVASLAASVLDIYSASLGVLIAGVRLGRWQAAIVVGVLGGVIGWIGGHDAGQVFANFQNFLLLMSYWLGPWIAITLVDHLIIRRGRVVAGATHLLLSRRTS